MKQLLSLITLLFPIGVYAQTAYDIQADSRSESISGAGARAEAFSNGQTGSFGAGRDQYNMSSQAADMSNMVPSVSAPALATTLTETCMGSSSAAASAAGFGFSFGTTWRDMACVRRLDARQLSAFGDLSTAREMMCESELVREAAKRAGRPCVADGGKPIVVIVPGQSQQTVPTEESASPIVNQQVR